MGKKIPVLIVLAVLFWGPVLADEYRYVKKISLPDGRVAVVAEGDLEPRSIGSYSVRLYRADNPSFPTDDFLGGIILSRNGTIRDGIVTDVDADQIPELVIVIESAGTGGYLSADAIDCSVATPVVKARVTDIVGDNTAVTEALKRQ